MKGSKLIIYISIFITSCTTFSYVEIETLAPAEIDIPVHLNKLVVIDRRSFNYTLSLTKNSFFSGLIFRDIDEETLQILDSLISDYYLGSLLENIKTEPRYNLISPDSSIIVRKNQNLETDLLSRNEVNSITQPYNADGVLSYESSSYFDKFKKNKNYEGSIDATIEIHILSTWFLYDKNKMNPIRISVRDTSFVDIFAYDIYDLEKKIPDPVSIIKESGINAGLTLIQKLSPYWVESNRLYFTGPGLELKNAGMSVIDGSWDYATTIWSKLAEVNNRYISTRAKFNMALACEMQEKYDMAWEWIKDLYIPMWNEELILYQNILQKRIADQKKLNKQFIQK